MSGYDLFRLSESDEEQAELVRLLYVATTRAADYLILSSGLASPESARGPWTELVCRHFDPVTGLARPAKPQAKDEASGKNFSLVKVTTSEPPVNAKAVGPTPRRNLEGLLEKARQMAAEGGGRAPKCLAAVPPDPAGWRQYSFSRLSGGLHARSAVTQDAADEGDERAAGRRNGWIRSGWARWSTPCWPSRPGAARRRARPWSVAMPRGTLPRRPTANARRADRVDRTAAGFAARRGHGRGG